MRRRTLLSRFALSSIVLATVQWGAMALFERYPTEWLFTPSHVIGGVVVAYFTLYLAEGFGVRVSWQRMLLVILCIGVAWELLELAAGTSANVWDASSDLIADIAGASVAYALAHRMP